MKFGLLDYSLIILPTNLIVYPNWQVSDNLSVLTRSRTTAQKSASSQQNGDMVSLRCPVAKKKVAGQPHQNVRFFDRRLQNLHSRETLKVAPIRETI